MSRPDVDAKRTRFATLHETGLFIMPNAWDLGSARLLASRGFAALATTSSGHAASLGRQDQRVRRDELIAHAALLAGVIDVPLNVDTERCFPEEPGGIPATVQMVAESGAAGFSIEDYDPNVGIVPVEEAADRVAAAARAARQHGLVLTARAEHHLYGHADLADTIARLRAYREAGADVVYAPGLTSEDAIRQLVAAVAAPHNILALAGGPSVDELASLGVRRVSTGGALAFAAYGAMDQAAEELLGPGTSTYAARSLSHERRSAAFG